ncbi:enoyl-CoA hydratase/isomerase family protein [Actinocatenispora rupis]|uniref:Crotonase n=1 Tax=Actinocatenispora rupis TaxID=519421 RepID=A0A8J3NA40_9ACTN|nr:enoyl-CoA hydratase/isomerase family protein [Actinocatenispora rupis]GID11706.1 crotonase [Actinocatenispora rupis]
MAQSLIGLTVDGPTAVLTLDRSAKLNALNRELLADLGAALDRVEQEPDVRVVVLRGSGRAFSVGLDLTMVADEGVPADFFELQERVYRRFEALPAVTVALVHGFCLGGAIQLALTADVRICCEDAKLGMPAVDEGMFPGLMPYRLARTVGPRVAVRLMLAGGNLTPAEAYEAGLVDHVVPDADAAEALIAPYRTALHAVPLTKRLIGHGLTGTYREAYDDCLATLKADR